MKVTQGIHPSVSLDRRFFPPIFVIKLLTFSMFIGNFRILKNPQIRLYLHGHIHSNWVHRLARDSAPELLLVNSAASCAKLFAGQISSFHQIVLEESNVKINPILLN